MVKMEIPPLRVRKKLGEAGFFLAKMEEEERPTGDVQHMAYYLSAFLSAGMSLRKGFHVEQNPACNNAVQWWQKQWVANLSPPEKSLYNFMGKERIVEVHRSGSTRTLGQEEVDLSRDMIRSGRRFSEEEYVTGYKPTCSFTIDGSARKATEACREYLVLLQRMVVEFEAAHQ
jgi:hypothetical protein